MTSSALEPFAEDVFVAARPQRFWGIETGTRMTVVRMGGGGLFVHCPVALDADTRRAVDDLGEVAVVAAPSLFHHLYAGEWRGAYPRAEVWACPGLDRKRPDLEFTGVLGEDTLPSIRADLEQAPLTARFEREVVFFHPKSRTLLCADALLNLSTHPAALTRTVAFLMGNSGPGKGYLERIAVRDYPLGRRQVDRIAEWDIDRIVLAHGDPVPGDGRRVLREAYAWLKG